MKKIIIVTIMASLLFLACEKTEEVAVENTIVEEKVEIVVNPENLTQEHIDEIVTLLDERDGETGISEIKTLVTGGDIINARYGYKTALMWASENGYEEIAQALIAVKSDVNAYNKDGLTALDLAKNNGHSEVVAMLQKAGAKEIN